MQPNYLPQVVLQFKFQYSHNNKIKDGNQKMFFLIGVYMPSISLTSCMCIHKYKSVFLSFSVCVKGYVQVQVRKPSYLKTGRIKLYQQQEGLKSSFILLIILWVRESGRTELGTSDLEFLLCLQPQVSQGFSLLKAPLG